MRLFLVRHGESVDNVAGLYAGSRNAPLTAHGVIQARRLGTHLASSLGLSVSHVFSSDLQRASDTAQAILDAVQSQGDAQDRKDALPGEVVRVRDLQERDFRSGEGVRVSGDASGRNAFADAETHAEMRVRAEHFVAEHLVPLLEGGVAETIETRSVVVVSHGLFLNVLLATLLQRFAPSELARLSRQGPNDTAPRLHCTWSNTGYVEVVTEKKKNDGLNMRVVAVNAADHLVGLKKTRGGIGSARFDAKQRTMDAFFAPAAKRRRGDGA